MAEELGGLFVHLGETVWNLVSLISDRMATNVGGSITNMTAQQWIRLIAIVGAYALLRPYIIKLGAKHQEKQFEKAQQEVAEISPNQLRGELGIPDESDDDDDDDHAQGEATATDWGKKARKRQRNMIKQLLDAEEKRLQETLDEQEDKDIEEFLID
ncbi:hypothetical protein RRF57_002882 [Xylaria bambusicola]|uniref:DUF1531-domain-containing protein n=1 Tax=Xylaria bambusicola TaxID=326684 RepID=A0AAN7Z279_9PEZI